MNRMDSRHPRLEKLGEQTARKYAERMDIATNHLIYEGVTEAQACNDALYLSMYCSDETFEVIRSMEEQYLSLIHISLYLPNLDRYVTFIKGAEKNTIQVNVKELLHDIKDRVLSAEIHYNLHTTEIASDIEGVKYFDIFTGKEIEKQ